ncbi:hypothetical protein OS190_11255 [Sulfitobacter sp. F26204]|uniref:hypothetical protein n=1 Tax=Sulfitobacter sp. F26204 TaxID=2996014 RepID=UPI00225E2A34|nr:hypothetical protein [Sulfitobacter sp. F26204]MCX7560146.1 hypothetical protein [Sulfitobacter sp. F26204]
MSTFEIEIRVKDGETQIPEDQIVEYAKGTPDRFESYMHLEGLITFVIGDARLEIEDTLSYVLPTLALEVLSDLVSEGEIKFILNTSPEKFFFKSDGTTVTMTGNYLPETLEFRQDDMISAVLEACRRFLIWAEQIWPNIGIADDLTMLNEVKAELNS